MDPKETVRTGADCARLSLFSQEELCCMSHLYFVHYYHYFYSKIEILTTLTEKIAVFWNVTPCSVEDIYHYFGADYRNWLFGCEVSTSDREGN